MKINSERWKRMGIRLNHHGALNKFDRFESVPFPYKLASLSLLADLSLLKDCPDQQGKGDSGIHIDSGIGRFFLNLTPGLCLLKGAA
jgi:hypothetical protein